MAQGLQDHEQYFDYTCNYMCVSKNRVSESTKFCTECIRHLCSSCQETHQDLYKTHRLVDTRASSQYRRNSTITEHCWKHPGKVSDLFCRSHDAVVCSACFPEHQLCGPASYIPEVVNDILHVQEVKQTSNQLAELGRELDCLTIGNNDGKKSDDDNERIISDIKRYSTELISIIKRLEDTAIKEVQATSNAKREAIRKTDDVCIQMKTELQACLSNLLSAEDNKPQQFVCIKYGERLATSADQLLQNIRTTTAENQTCGYTIDSKIREAVTGFRSLITVIAQPSQALPDLQLRALQAQQIKKQDMKQPIKHGQMLEAQKHNTNNSRSTSVATKEPKLLRMSKVQKYNVRCKNGRTPTIWGCCVLSNSCVILSDNTNKALKLFDPSTNMITKTLKLTTSPYGVCCLSTQEVAVLLSNNTIQFVSTIPSLALSTSFRVDHGASAIACRDDCLFISDWDTNVYIHHLDGSLVQIIPVPGVSSIYDVAVSPGGELLYVTDEGGLTCLERSGRPVYTGGVGGGSCIGVCVDESGRVVAVDAGIGVFQVGEDGKILTELLDSSDGLKLPSSVCVDSNNMKMYVTQTNDDEIIVASMVLEKET